MAAVVYLHQLLRGPHAVVRFATHNPRRHDVARSQILQFAQVGSCEGAHKVALRDDANHARAWFADGHRANIVRVHEARHAGQTVIRQARHKLLT